jgi:hypothetical protein
MKLPALIYHFIEHKENKKDLSFAEYINMHYSRNNDADNDINADMKLPFKSMINSGISILSPCIPSNQPICELKPVDSKTEQPLVSYEFAFSNAYLDSIWQPPKHC